ncbi:MAG: hypothetical protein COS19_04585 [Flavobacteriaceae bacterium CG02_land_8_20_14_3_00_34_13]|nr:MAG: hypothetical protein COS19_04585 [Flavobacteriaceae bacterium CG02_land_8_20_14_3_00_34_13]
MKHLIIISLAFGMASFTTLHAQENKNIEKETTTTKVIVKGTEVETVVAQEVSEKKSIIEVDGTNQTNQDSSEKVIKSGTETNIQIEDPTVNVINQAQLDQMKKEGNPTIDGVQRGAPTRVTTEILVEGKKCTCVCSEKKEGTID